MKSLARFVWEHGLTPIPTSNKKPLIDWKVFQFRNANYSEFQDILELIKTEFAIPVKRTEHYLVIIDIDSWELWPDTISIPSYATKTPHGYHIPFASKFPLKTRHFAGIDIIGQGGLVMFPGSLTSDGLYDGNPEYYIHPPEFFPSDFINQVEIHSKLRAVMNNKKPVPKPEVKPETKPQNPSLSTNEIAEIIRPFWMPGRRHNIALAVAAYFRKRGFSKEWISELLSNFEDEESRENQIKYTFSKPIRQVASWIWAPDLIEALEVYINERSSNRE